MPAAAVVPESSAGATNTNTRNHNHTTNNHAATAANHPADPSTSAADDVLPARGGLGWWLHVISLVLRILLWPLRRLVMIAFPTGEYDGMSPAVTSKAVQAFASKLLQLSLSLSSNNSIASTSTSSRVMDVFPGSSNGGALGFHAFRNKATSSSSLMFVYLDSPLHAKSQQACKDLLLSDTFLDFLTCHPSNLMAMGVDIHTAQGANLAQMLAITSYPACALLQPTSSSTTTTTTTNNNNIHNTNNTAPIQLLFQAQGQLLTQMTPLQLVGYLQSSVQRHQSVLAEHEARRILREQETQLRREQDEEYQETLRTDQERQRLQQETLETGRLQQQQAKEIEDLAIQQKQDSLERARAILGEEPTANEKGSGSGITRVRFVLPSGQKLDRRFESTQTVEALRAFLHIHFHDQTVPIVNFGFSTSYPKQAFQNDKETNEQTLEEAGIAPQAVLMVQDLDA